MQNYTLLDTVSTSAIIPAFAIFMLAPGYAFGYATNLFQFRVSGFNRKVLLSVPISLVISTILTNIVGRYIPFQIILWMFILTSAAVCFHACLYWMQSRKEISNGPHRATKIVLLLAILWTVVVIVSLIDIQAGKRLYVSTALWDHAVRIAFLQSALRSGPPPVNPFSYLGYAPIARYYYYWYVLCSYPARLTHIGARYVLYGSSVWAGFSLAAIVPLYLASFMEIKENIRRRSIIGILLLSVTGLDIIPIIYEFFRAKIVYADMEWWDPVQVTSWQDALIWVPHHVAALVACFIGFLALWSVRIDREMELLSRIERFIACIFAGFSFAAAAGLSVYVTFTFGLFLLCWGIRLACKRRFQDFFLYIGTACFTFLISLPYLHDLLPRTAATVSPHGAASSSGSGGFIAFGLRALPSFLSTPYFLKVRGFSHPELFAPFALVVVYILEFGVFAIVGWSRLKKDIRNRSRLTEAEIASWYLIVIGMFVITFVRSSVISNNDLAYRSAMIVQFILLLWGAEYIDRWLLRVAGKHSKFITIKNIAIASTLLLGFIGTLYSLTILRTYTILEDAGKVAQPATWLPQPPQVGTELFYIRHAFEQMDRMLSPDSIVQYNPMTDDYLTLLEYDRFQSVDAFPDCGTEFGGDAGKCAPVQAIIANLFNKPQNYNIQEICRNISANVLVARSSDPVWRDPDSWVWTNSPIVENAYIRAFRCD